MNGAGPVAAPSSTDIFGRDDEFTHISTFLNAIPRGPRSLLLEGEPGVGKTTVWRWALEQASSSSYRVLSCRPAEAEAKFSYAALADLLAGVVDDILPYLPPPQRRALEVVLLRADQEGESLDRRVVAATVAAALRIVARSSPTLLAIDDAQWLDTPSARVLQFAGRRLLGAPIGVLVTQRRREDGGVALGLDQALGGDDFSRLHLPPLSVGAVHHMVRARLGTEFSRSVLLQLHQTSGGNPFYALEIARDLLAQGRDPATSAVPVPRTLRDLVEHRLARLPRRTQDLLLTVAALSHPTLALVTAAAEHPKLAEADLDRASHAGVIEVDSDRLQFTHPLLATVHYTTASTGRRRALHRRLAGIVSDIEERARHLALAATEPDESIAHAIDEAAGRARARGAPEAAAALLEESIRLTPSEDPDAKWRRMIDAAMCHYVGNNTERARQLWEEIEHSAPPGPARADALWHLIEFRHSTLDPKRQLAAGSRALEEAGENRALKSAIHHTIAFTLTWGGDVRTAQGHARAALDLAEGQSDPMVIGLARTALLWVTYLSGQGVSDELIDRAMALEHATRHLPLENSPRLGRAVFLAQVGEAPDAARQEFAELRRQAQDTGLDVSLPLLYFFMSDFESRHGGLDLAGRYAAESLDATARSEQLFRAPLGLLAQALVESRRGELDTARATANEALAMAIARHATRFVEARIWAMFGFIELSRGDPESAHRWLKQVTELEESGGYEEPTAFRSMHDAIEALVEVGDLQEANRLVDTLESRGRRLNRAWALAVGARCRGLLAAAQGDLNASQAGLERAVAEHERLLEPFELGRTLLALGNVQRRRRQKRAAILSLQRAADLFSSLGALGMAGKAQAEMLRAGAPAGGKEELSPTEQRVAQLVAAGRTNREIAGALFMSVKAVEANLTRVYAKLEVRSRTQLAVRLQRGA